jgi:hypothetical protein
VYPTRLPVFTIFEISIRYSAEISHPATLFGSQPAGAISYLHSTQQEAATTTSKEDKHQERERESGLSALCTLHSALCTLHSAQQFASINILEGFTVEIDLEWLLEVLKCFMSHQSAMQRGASPLPSKQNTTQAAF